MPQSPGIQVQRNLRVHDDRRRYIRVVGDGTPENTKLLDYKTGDPIPESVVEFMIRCNAGGCAKGVFDHVVEGAIQTFHAWVVFETEDEKQPARVLA